MVSRKIVTNYQNQINKSPSSTQTIAWSQDADNEIVLMKIDTFLRRFTVFARWYTNAALDQKTRNVFLHTKEVERSKSRKSSKIFGCDSLQVYRYQRHCRKKPKSPRDFGFGCIIACKYDTLLLAIRVDPIYKSVHMLRTLFFEFFHVVDGSDAVFDLLQRKCHQLKLHTSRSLW